MPIRSLYPSRLPSINALSLRIADLIPQEADKRKELRQKLTQIAIGVLGVTACAATAYYFAYGSVSSMKFGFFETTGQEGPTPGFGFCPAEAGNQTRPFAESLPLHFLSNPFKETIEQQNSTCLNDNIQDINVETLKLPAITQTASSDPHPKILFKSCKAPVNATSSSKTVETSEAEEQANTHKESKPSVKEEKTGSTDPIKNQQDTAHSSETPKNSDKTITYYQIGFIGLAIGMALVVLRSLRDTKSTKAAQHSNSPSQTAVSPSSTSTPVQSPSGSSTNRTPDPGTAPAASGTKSVVPPSSPGIYDQSTIIADSPYPNPPSQTAVSPSSTSTPVLRSPGSPTSRTHGRGTTPAASGTTRVVNPSTPGFGDQSTILVESPNPNPPSQTAVSTSSTPAPVQNPLGSSTSSTPDRNTAPAASGVASVVLQPSPVFGDQSTILVESPPSRTPSPSQPFVHGEGATVNLGVTEPAPGATPVVSPLSADQSSLIFDTPQAPGQERTHAGNGSSTLPQAAGVPVTAVNSADISQQPTPKRGISKLQLRRQEALKVKGTASPAEQQSLPKPNGAIHRRRRIGLTSGGALASTPLNVPGTPKQVSPHSLTSSTDGPADLTSILADSGSESPSYSSLNLPVDYGPTPVHTPFRNDREIEEESSMISSEEVSDWEPSTESGSASSTPFSVPVSPKFLSPKEELANGILDLINILSQPLTIRKFKRDESRIIDKMARIASSAAEPRPQTAIHSPIVPMTPLVNRAQFNQILKYEGLPSLEQESSTSDTSSYGSEVEDSGVMVSPFLPIVTTSHLQLQANPSLTGSITPEDSSFSESFLSETNEESPEVDPLSILIKQTNEVKMLLMKGEEIDDELKQSILELLNLAERVLNKEGHRA